MSWVDVHRWGMDKPFNMWVSKWDTSVNSHFCFFTVNSLHLESSAYPNRSPWPLKGGPASLGPGMWIGFQTLKEVIPLKTSADWTFSYLLDLNQCHKHSNKSKKINRINVIKGTQINCKSLYWHTHWYTLPMHFYLVFTTCLHLRVCVLLLFMPAQYT